MGAWGTTVLENDCALDAMISLSKCKNAKKAVVDFLESEYIDEQLLAVEIVDISINGVDESILGSFYEYREWFENLTKNPMNELRENAIKTLEYIKEHDLNWFPAYAEERKGILYKIEKRLKGCAMASDGVEK